MSESSEKSSLGIVIGMLLFFFLTFFIVAAALYSLIAEDDGVDGDRIGVVEINGEISSADATVRTIDKYSDDDTIKAVLIRINSPGGSVAASQDMAEAIAALKKPAIISMGDVAASGGYYVACAGPKIFASAGTLTGSIGVISQIMEFKDLLSFFNVNVTTIKTGELKDSGSPFRAFNETDKRYFTDLGLEIYDQFVEHVAAARNKSKEEIKAIADGRVWTGREAKKLGLIDEIGGFHAAVEELKKQADIKKKAVLVYPDKNTGDLINYLLQEGASSVSQGIQSGIKEMADTRKTFQYLYK